MFKVIFRSVSFQYSRFSLKICKTDLIIFHLGNQDVINNNRASSYTAINVSSADYKRLVGNNTGVERPIFGSNVYQSEAEYHSQHYQNIPSSFTIVEQYGHLASNDFHVNQHNMNFINQSTAATSSSIITPQDSSVETHSTK